MDSRVDDYIFDDVALCIASVSLGNDYVGEPCTLGREFSQYDYQVVRRGGGVYLPVMGWRGHQAATLCVDGHKRQVWLSVTGQCIDRRYW